MKLELIVFIGNENNRPVFIKDTQFVCKSRTLLF